MKSYSSRPSSTWPSIISLQLIKISLFLMLPSIGSIRCPIPSVSDQGRRECRGRREEGQEAPKTCKSLATHPTIFRKEGLLKYLSGCSGLEAGDLASLEQPLEASCFCWIGAAAGLSSSSVASSLLMLREDVSWISRHPNARSMANSDCFLVSVGLPSVTLR